MGLSDFFRRTDINEELSRYKDTDGAVLLDVRSPEEFSNGHIPGSINIPVDRIQSAPDILNDKNIPIFSYCLRGPRSRRAVNALRKMGYTNVTSIGGIAGYKGEITRK